MAVPEHEVTCGWKSLHSQSTSKAFERRRAPRALDGALGDEFDSQSARRPTGAISRVPEKGTTQRRRTLDEVIDALQLLTVTDVCKLLRISKPTLWRLGLSEPLK
jgi:hypothetical protein